MNILGWPLYLQLYFADKVGVQERVGGCRRLARRSIGVFTSNADN